MAKIDPETGRRVKTGGRQKGTKNKKTETLNEALERAAKMINGPRTPEWFDKGAHELLKTIYQCPEFPVRTRMAAAEVCLKVETPTLQSVDTTVQNTRNYVVRVPEPIPGGTQKERLANWIKQIEEEEAAKKGDSAADAELNARPRK
jgi:hypothetical protein